MCKIMTLYVGSQCHLCDQAKDIIKRAIENTNWVCSEVNIENNELLLEKYGLRIPVVVSDNGEEKGWPFTLNQVRRLIQ